jgi:molybdopterin/thiamine biosynthesis adenylyltransferase
MIPVMASYWISRGKGVHTDLIPFLQRLRTAKILLITVKSLGNEIAKNLVLAGIGSLTIIDHAVVSEEDLGAQFFVSQDHLGQNVRP